MLAQFDAVGGGAPGACRRGAATGPRQRARCAAPPSLANEACALADVGARREAPGRAAQPRARLARGGRAGLGHPQAGAASCAARRAGARWPSHASRRRGRAGGAAGPPRARPPARAVRRPGARHPRAARRARGPRASSSSAETSDVRDRRGLRDRHPRVRVGRAHASRAPRSPALTGIVDRIRPKVQKLDVLGTDPAARTDARIVEVEVRLDDPSAAAGSPISRSRSRSAAEPWPRSLHLPLPLGWLQLHHQQLRFAGASPGSPSRWS